MKTFQPGEFRAKKGRFGYSFLNERGEKLPRSQKNKLGVKFYETNDHYDKAANFTIQVNGEESKQFQTLFQYDENQAMIYSAKGGSFLNVNFKTGIISPEYVSFAETLYLAADGQIYKMDDDGNSIDTGFKVAEKSLHGYKFVQDRDGSLKVISSEGKYGRIDGEGKVCCPFIFDDNNFYCHDLDTKLHLTDVCDHTNNKLYVLDKNGEIIFNIDYDRKNMDFSHIRDNRFMIRDKRNDLSIIYEYDADANTFSEIGKVSGKVKDSVRVGDDIYLTINDTTLKKLGDDKAILKDCQSIRFENIDGEPVVSFKVSGQHKRLNTMGVYSLQEQREILSPSKMITNISFKDSAKMEDGSYRYFCQATLDRGNYNPESRLWGVVDDNGKTLLPFDYSYNPNKKQTFIRKDKGREVVETVLQGQYSKYYFNIRENNFIATREQEKKIKLPKEKRETRWADYQPTLKQSKYSEDEKFTAATLATIISGSPLAGMFVYGIMDEAERE